MAEDKIMQTQDELEFPRFFLVPVGGVNLLVRCDSPDRQFIINRDGSASLSAANQLADCVRRRYAEMTPEMAQGVIAHAKLRFEFAMNPWKDALIITSDNVMFADIQVPCQCMSPEDEDNWRCRCGPQEIVIRAYSSGATLRPMTPEERAWCAKEADQAGEGSCNAEQLMTLPDKELAQALLEAWKQYADTH